MSFYFLGSGPDSKSLLLRALIVKSYFPNFQIKGNDKFQDCKDVYYMKQGLKSLSSTDQLKIYNKNESINESETSHHVINCHHGGAVLRFLALRCAREKMNVTLKGSASLFNRPMKELKSLLNQLGCETHIEENSIKIKSTGWHILGDALHVSGNRSSQFASAVLLNSWKLSYPLFLKIEDKMSSASYFQMTLSFLRSLGMHIDEGENEYHIPAHQEIRKISYQPGQDMSCLFALSALAVINGELCITDWPNKSLQPDFVFPEILKDMGVSIEQTGKKLKVHGIIDNLKPIEWNMNNCPDLFPVLAVLCSLANGTSKLYGAPHLVYKESNRIQQIADLLNLVDRKTKILEDGLIIEGIPIKENDWGYKDEILFNSKEDHRLAMAGAVLKEAGLPVKILNPEVVNKSFPDFWSLTGINP